MIVAEATYVAYWVRLTAKGSLVDMWKEGNLGAFEEAPYRAQGRPRMKTDQHPEVAAGQLNSCLRTQARQSAHPGSVAIRSFRGD